MSAADYIEGDKLGSGAFGDVYKGRQKSTGMECAIKKMDKRRFRIEEVEALEILQDHDHIVKLFDVFPLGQHLNIVLEFCNGGNLEEYVVKKNPAYDVILTFMEQMADAVSFSHKKDITHRDLKPENILITMRKKKPWIKVADFGLAKIPANMGQILSTAKKSGNYLYTAIGTLLYMAPEVWARRYTNKADVFSLGVLFCAILERQILENRLVIFFSDRVQMPIGLVQHTQHSASDAIRVLRPEVQAHDDVRNIINRMIKPGYKTRPTAEEVYNTLQ